VVSTQKQIAANRANAKRSTGPRTAQGKAKSAGNSLRHGLTAVAKHVETTVPIASLAKELVGAIGGADGYSVARIFAETTQQIVDVRTRRALLLSEAMSTTGGDANEMAVAVRAIGEGDRREVVDDLVKLERYERRATSRRRKIWHKPSRTGAGSK